MRKYEVTIERKHAGTSHHGFDTIQEAIDFAREHLPYHGHVCVTSLETGEVIYKESSK